MALDIRPTTLDDLTALGPFLTAGFQTAPDAAFAAADVLRWKYFDPRGSGAAPRSYLACEAGRIVGHLGLCTGSFLGAALPSGAVATLHMIDWLSARPGASVGARLMLRSHEGYPTQYGLGGTAAGRSVIGGGGYMLVGTVPVFQKVLRLAALLRAQPKRWARELVQAAVRLPRAPLRRVELRRVPVFGPEVEPILAAYQRQAVFSNRCPELLNHFLRYPRGGITGWLLASDGAVRGFALLAVTAQGPLRIGKVVDCVLDALDADLWAAALDALTGQLAEQEVDVALAYGSTAWTADALRACGYRATYRLDFRLRDKQHQVPPDAVFHLSPIEADYAYT